MRHDATDRMNSVLALPEDRSATGALLHASRDPSADIARRALRRLARAGRPRGGGRAARHPADLPAPPGDRCGADVEGARGSRERHDPAASVRAAALQALAWLGADEATASACARLLEDEHPFVRIAAVRAVAGAGRSPGALLEPATHDEYALVRREAARFCSRLTAHGARTLIADRDRQVREAAARGAGRVQGHDLERALAHDADPAVRIAAAQTLARLRDRAAAPALVAQLRDTDAVARAAALRALQTLLSRDGLLAELECELAAPQPRRRSAAVYTLGHLQASERAHTGRARGRSRPRRAPRAGARRARHLGRSRRCLAADAGGS